MKARDIMTAEPAYVTPGDSLQHAAQVMEENDCGCLPVISEDGEREELLGVVTDRDIALRAVAQGLTPDTPVESVMTKDVESCLADDEVEDVERLMADRQVRRVVIVDDTGECVGIVAQADLARAAKHTSYLSPELVADVLERISQPPGDLR
jgi:CBS domain-containing protein